MVLAVELNELDTPIRAPKRACHARALNNGHDRVLVTVQEQHGCAIRLSVFDWRNLQQARFVLFRIADKLFPVSDYPVI